MKPVADTTLRLRCRLAGLALTILSLPAAAAAVSAVPARPLDHLFVGNHIVTMEPDYLAATPPSALGVIDDRIAWIGEVEDAARLTDADTRIHQLGERALLPGFIDAHGHLTFLAATIAWANLAPPPVGPVTDLETLEQELSAYIRDHQIPPGAWVIGNGYDDSLIAERRHPDRTVLDEVSRDHPIALLHVSGHLMAVNSLALEQVGIDAETPDPDGGHIRRTAGSNLPNGVLEETATYPVRGVLMQPRGNPLDDLDAALARYAGYGITTVQDGAISPPQIALLESAAEGNRLTLDVVVYPVLGSPDLSPLDGIEFGGYHNRLRIGGVKLVLDGSPQGKTAYLTAPYEVPPDGKPSSYRGYPIHQDDEVDAMVGALLARAVPILAHANGDAAADQLLHAVAASKHASRDHRTVMIHAQTVREDQLDLMFRLGLIPSYFSAHVFYWGDWHRESVLGEVRARRISPTRSSADRGMVFTVHNDAPIVPPDMIRLLWATTNRLTRTGKVLGEAQRISTFEALEAMTRHAAYQYFEENDKGTLSVGKLADLVILSEDPLALDPADLQQLEVQETWSHGRQVFSKPEAE